VTLGRLLGTIVSVTVSVNVIICTAPCVHAAPPVIVPDSSGGAIATDSTHGKEASPPRETRRIAFESDDLFPKRVCIGTFVGEQPDGEVRCYGTNDSLCSIEHYERGVLVGERIEYYPNGFVFSREAFDHGQAEAVSRRWYPNGQALSSTEFHDGIVDGRSVMFFNNGAPAIVATLVKGVYQGERRHFLPDGHLFAITQWRDGREVNRRTLLQPTQADVEAIQEMARWGAFQLKDFWESE